MYHYLKWAALSLFFKRNFRYLLLIVAGFVGIYVADAVYRDMAEYSVMTEQTENISRYLFLKWIAVLFFAGMIVWSIFRLGFSSSKGDKKAKKEKKRREPEPDDPYMKRLEKFKTPKKLRSRTDLMIEKRRKRGF